MNLKRNSGVWTGQSMDRMYGMVVRGKPNIAGQCRGSEHSEYKLVEMDHIGALLVSLSSLDKRACYVCHSLLW